MNPKESSDTDRRSFLKVSAAFVAGGVCCGFLQEIGKDVYGYVKGLGLEPGKAGAANKVLADLLFAGEPTTTAVVPPGTNRHLLAKGLSTPSRYVRKAFSVATSSHKAFAGLTKDHALDIADPHLKLATHKNLLVLGGPVATDLAKYLCGYIDVSAPSDGKLVPVPRQTWPLPYYFHVGNRLGYGRWGSEFRSGLRLLEDGKEESCPLYGIRLGVAGRPIAPPMVGRRVAGDMLMITRIPNPRNSKGTITMIGGLHGYSLEAFFSDVGRSAQLMSSLTENYKHDYFQALIPYRIDNSGKALISLDSSDQWRPRVSKIDGQSYLSHFGSPKA